MFGDSYTPDEWDAFMSDMLANYYAVTKGDAVYVCIASTSASTSRELRVRRPFLMQTTSWHCDRTHRDEHDFV